LLPTELFHVSRQMRRDAMDVFFPRTVFEFAQDYSETIQFLKALPAGAAKLIRRMTLVIPQDHFRAFFDRWGPNAYKQKKTREEHSAAFGDLLQFIKTEMNLPRLRLQINMWEIAEWCAWAEDEEENRFVYDAYLEIADALCSLRGIGAVEFDMSWACDMRPWLTREVMGKDYEVPPDPRPRHLNAIYPMPPTWHDDVDEFRLPHSNYDR
jgi:hypothetical protein